MWGPCKRNPQSEQSLHIRQPPLRSIAKRKSMGPSHHRSTKVYGKHRQEQRVQRDVTVSLRSKMPDQPTRHKKVVLATLTGVHIELRHARPEIPEFSPHAKPSEDPHIQAQTGL
jgi:hypothetical protein